MRGLAVAVAVASLSVLSVGCGADPTQLGYTPARMDPDPVRKKTREVSSRLVEMTGVKGRVTESHMSGGNCDTYGGDDRFMMHHSWSLYGLTGDQVGNGMETLHKALVENGWTIISETKADSSDQHAEIYAANEAEHFSVMATLKRGDREPRFDFSVHSACYRAASAYAANHA
ncbi:hypothetical protein [Streptomyces sp. NPDC047718]|uniref:hypothetical protein n=1 Tax=Streptomyces sp. NPDC047718 TaxID=3155479 RepID=UPI0034080C84